jgi:hypothetical protein
VAKRIEEPKIGLPVNEYGPIIRQIVRRLNALSNMSISPDGLGRVDVADANAKIIFNTDTCDS